MKERADFNYKWFDKKSPNYAKVIRCGHCNKFASWNKIMKQKNAAFKTYLEWKCYHCEGLLNC